MNNKNKRLEEKIRDKFDSRIEFKNIISDTSINCFCNVHKIEFKINKDYILRKKCKDACPLCHGLYNEDIVKETLKNKFNNNIILVSNWIFRKTNVFTKLVFKCSIHGEFTENLNNVLHYKYGCSKCAYDNANKNKNKKPINELKNLLNKYNVIFNEKEFINVNTPIKFYLNEKLLFKKAPSKLLYNDKFEYFLNKYLNKKNQSRGEFLIEQILTDENIDYTYQKVFDNLIYKNKLKIDFFIEKENCVIEFNGSQHKNKNSKFYSKEQEIRDRIKEQYIKDNNIRFFKIEKENNHDITKSEYEYIKSNLLTFLNSSTTSKTINIK